MLRLLMCVSVVLAAAACVPAGDRIAAPDTAERPLVQRYIEFCQRC